MFGSIIQSTGEYVLEAEEHWGVPFLLPPSQLMLSQLHFTAQGRNSLLLQSLGEYWKIASCQSSSKKASEGFEQFVSKWYFYLYGNAQTFKHKLYFCINSKWMISYPWIKSLETMMVRLALYWWCHLIVPALCILPHVSVAAKIHCGCSSIPVTYCNCLWSHRIDGSILNTLTPSEKPHKEDLFSLDMYANTQLHNEGTGVHIREKTHPEKFLPTSKDLQGGRKNSEKLIPDHGDCIRLNNIYLCSFSHQVCGLRYRWLTWWDY